MCVLAGAGGYQGERKKKSPPLSYMHMAVHQLIAGKGGGGWKGKRGEARLQSSLWSPRVPV